jgi:hypothetical protein
MDRGGVADYNLVVVSVGSWAVAVVPSAAPRGAAALTSCRGGRLRGRGGTTLYTTPFESPG